MEPNEIEGLTMFTAMLFLPLFVLAFGMLKTGWQIDREWRSASEQEGKE